LSSYGFSPIILTNDTITKTDLIRRRWLNNDFYGAIFSLNYKNKGLDLTFGGSANEYKGAHYGEVIWAEFSSDSESEIDTMTMMQKNRSECLS